MSSERFETKRRAVGPMRSFALALAAAAGTVLTVPATASTGAASGHASAGASGTAAMDVLAHAHDLLGRGKAYHAQSILEEMTVGGRAMTLTEDQNERLAELLRRARVEIRDTDLASLSIQKASYLLGKDRLVDAERHAKAVLLSDQADAAQRQTAENVVTLVEMRREALAPFAAERLNRAIRSFEAGRYSAAKGEFESISSLGLPLSAADEARMADYASRVRDIEVAQRRDFTSTPVALGVLQPGVVESGSWTQPEPGAEPAEEPAAEPTDDPVGDMLGGGDVVAEAMQGNAMDVLTQADVAYGAGRWGDAIRLYERVLGAEMRGLLSPAQVRVAEENLDDARLEVRGQRAVLGGDDPLDDTIATNALIAQRLEAEYTALMERGEASLASGAIEDAQFAAAQARLTIRNQAADILPAPQVAAWEAAVDDLFSRIQIRDEALRIEAIERETAELDTATRDAQRELESEKQRRIGELIARVRDLQVQRDYVKALQEVDQILFLDPNNPSGLALRDIIRETKMMTDYLQSGRDKDLARSQTIVDAYDAMTPPPDIINYPPDWVEITELREGGITTGYVEAPENRPVLDGLRDRRLPVNFNEDAFEDVLRFIRGFAGLDIDIDWDSLEEIGVDREAPVSLTLTDVSLLTVLEKVLERVSDPSDPAGWAINEGILTIASDEVLRRDTLLEIYDVRDLTLDIPRFDDAPDFDLDSIFQAANQGGGGGGGQSPFGNDDIETEQRTPEELLEELSDIIRDNVDPDGWLAAGGTTGVITPWNGNLIIRNTAKNHRGVVGLLSKLRAVRALQMNVESRFLLVSEDYFEQIGFDIDVYFGASNDLVSFARGQDPGVTAADFFDPTGGLVGTPTVSSGGIFVDSDGDGAPDSPANPNVLAPNAPATQFSPATEDSFSPIGTQQNSLGIVDALTGDVGIAGEIAGAGLGPAISVGGRFLDDIQVDFLVQATQADRRSTSLTAPRLTLTNGQTAFILFATQRSFVSDLEPVTSDSAVAFDPEIGVVSEGVNLTVEGVISSDRRYVTLNVTNELAEVEFDTELEIEAAAGGGGIGGGGGGAVATGRIQRPIVTTSSVNTTVTIPDQGTILIGGQKIVSEVEVESGVPVLSKIPIINRFFANRSESRNEQTLMILMRPTILIQNEQEETRFPGIIDSLTP